ncbi:MULTISPECIES: glycosidase [Microbacterium]|uniref:Glycosidase n=1 Tax=Microbacterium wangchenii TaxID=2541726 RepID=A0ABX5SSX0_9MICO|nr:MULTISPECIES: glycosidase [Microbacterium]MCK6066620.1 glycosidase [Microbacterium sp. EYE_512]QBR87954.1 glycosidase [Microbacterium wangchenii]TXK18256.1 glycosidase [Microbacterium wangchenii]
MTRAVPYRLTRAGIVMTPDPGDPNEAEGVLNPGSGRGPDGELYLLPRLVAAGNVSRVGLARVVVEGGVPVGVVREGVVLAPDRGWERGADHAGVEDPRITWIDVLGLHVMTYVAFGPLGPRTALAVSDDLRTWRRLGPALFRYQDDLDTDLNLFHNKDTVFFPEPVRAPDGTEALAVLHRPMWDLGETRPGQGVRLPAGVEDPRQSVWISYVPLAAVLADVGNLTLWEHHRFVAGPQFAFEELKIGGGPPPLRVPEGWLVLHHGVTGVIDDAFAQQQNVNYAAGALLLDAADPGRVLARTSEPLLAPETADERSGIVPNVVFPTAIEQIDGRHFVFYGMADSKIGVALLERSDATSSP